MKRFALLICTLVFCVPTTFAQNVAPRFQPNPRQAKNALRLLNLTPEQRVQIRVIRRRTEAERRDLTARLREANRQLETAIYADVADDNLIRERAVRVAEANSELIKFRARAELEIRRLLTPEQLAAFRNLRADAELQIDTEQQNRHRYRHRRGERRHETIN